MSCEKACTIEELADIARRLRIDALRMIHLAGGGHPGGSLSAADLVAALYFHTMNLRPDEPAWPERDRFVMSKGHACPILYAALARLGYFDRAHLDTLRKYGSILQGHPDMRKTPGIDTTSGSLGQGLSVGLGMALACAKDGILLVDEIENGIHWSALPEVWKFVVKVAKRLNVQVFATTHSNDCLRAFHVGTKDDAEMAGVAVRIEKRNGEFGVEIFDENRLAVIAKEAIEIR